MTQKIIALILLILSAPIFVVLFVIVKLTSPGPFIFKQKRVGLNKKTFTIYKIRTMIENAEKIQKKYKRLDEADGPVFKIRNDPRYTKFGRFFAHTALDELPQLLNIAEGNMAFVGPRPLPVNEAKNIPKKYDLRYSVLPGVTSPWIAMGSDHLDFDRWMKLDLLYIKNKSTIKDLFIVLATVKLLVGALFNEF